MSDETPDSPPDPRFLLASERTLLAWLRTSLAFVATGLALVAIRHAGVDSGWPLVGATVSSLAGVLIAVWAYLHWRAVEDAIRKSQPMPSPGIVPVLVLGVVVMAATVILAIVSL